FRISREEFMNYFFDDLALPRMIRTQLLADVPEWKYRRGLRQRRQPHQPARGALDARGPGPPHRHGWRRAPGTQARREAARRPGAAARRRAARSRDPEEAHRRTAPAPEEGAVPRPVRPALSQPRARTQADQQGRDVLPDG